MRAQEFDLRVTVSHVAADWSARPYEKPSAQIKNNAVFIGPLRADQKNKAGPGLTAHGFLKGSLRIPARGSGPKKK